MKQLLKANLKNGRKSQRFLIYTIILSYLFMVVLSQNSFLSKKRSLFSKQDTINFSGSKKYHEPGSAEFNFAIAMVIFLVMMAGICSGLNVGLLSIDVVALNLKIKSGTENEKKNAQQILDVLSNHHLLLSTLLVANALAMEALPIFFHEIIPAAFAVLFSTIIVVVFGEIIPQAYCTGPKQFEIASKSLPIIKLLILIFWIFCFPIAKFLDWLLGKHDSSKYRKNKKDLKALIELHENGQHDTHLQQFGFNKQEVMMISSTLDLREQKVTEKMIKLDDCFMLNTEDIFSKELILKIKQSGFSTIPIYDKVRTNIIGCLRTKIILGCENKHLNKPIATRFPLTQLLMIAKDTNMLQMIQIFQKKKCSLAIVTTEEKKKKNNEELLMSCRDMIVEHYSQIEGIIFLKDVFEEIVDIDFQDDDLHIKHDEKTKKKTKSTMKINNSLQEPLISQGSNKKN
ncbi:transmembrane protein, putative (macronuclear) [Tetrahymena thermophila SB210]|uniref:Transmembrane protein, putative n=1 Tax=Tetrahymena thermophila (strain SB210) TaxID=312017 RepID=I7M4K8_TETTS|nr:transmembrane protein, putative [Tetrahymena thermophila SB210]EAS07552.3 transmembrane protein, putative [Tetrahymena thermophila SB210]|eukprot:XP_001027794.3 transmembrane protein, putative [Tetrahymena thermophila SB210]